MESEPPTWDLLQLQQSRRLPPPHPSLLTPGSGNEELGAQRCGFVAVNCFIQLHH